MMETAHTVVLGECRERMDSIEETIAHELKHINERLTSIDAYLAGRITETRNWVEAIAKKFEGNGGTGFEARLRVLEVLIAKNADTIRSLAEQQKEDRKEAGKLQSRIMDATINVVVNGAIWGGLLYALWEKGLLSK